LPGLANRSVQLTEELPDLAEALWEAFEHCSSWLVGKCLLRVLAIEVGN
jgi:hypothetical protein